MAATNKDLKQALQNKKIRKDLYYRLKVIPIEIPPLRERQSDIPVLCDHFLNEFKTMRRSPLTISPEAMAALMRYPYPGNVRELRNILERISVLAKGERAEVKDLPRDILEQGGGGDEGSYNLALATARAEQECISRALQQSGGNKTEAARLLGISRKNLWEKLKESMRT